MGFLGGGVGNVLKGVAKGVAGGFGISLPIGNGKLLKREKALKNIAKSAVNIKKRSGTDKLNQAKQQMLKDDNLAKSIILAVDYFDDGELNESPDEEKIKERTRTIITTICSLGAASYVAYELFSNLL